MKSHEILWNTTSPRLPIKERIAVALPRRALVAGTPGVARVATAHTGRSAWKWWEPPNPKGWIASTNNKKLVVLPAKIKDFTE